MIIGYLRVSTEGQLGEDRFGLAAQRETIEAYARREGISIDEYRTDEAITGATLDRPALQQILDEAAQGKIQKVIVAKLDRLARDLYICLYVQRELARHGVAIVSASEPAGDGPWGQLSWHMLGAFAEFEKAMITLRMTTGRKAKARRGGYAGGGAAIGYTATRGAKVLELDPRKAEAVRMAFKLRAEYPTWRLQDIADALNNAGHTTARGAEFRPMQVKRILDREALYSGVYVYTNIEAEGKHPAII